MGSSRPAPVLFDLDGTLVDSLPDLARAINATRRDEGLPALPPSALGRHLGDGAPLLVARSFDTAADDPALARRLQRFRAHYATHCLDETTWFPGIPQLLRALRGRPLAIVSNKPVAFCERIVRGLPDGEGFERIFGGDSTPNPKPHPAVAELAIEELAWEGDRRGIWLVGDGPQDMGAARAAGLRALGCTWGHHSEATLRAAGAHAIATRVSELHDLLLQ